MLVFTWIGEVAANLGLLFSCWRRGQASKASSHSSVGFATRENDRGIGWRWGLVEVPKIARSR